MGRRSYVPDNTQQIIRLVQLLLIAIHSQGEDSVEYYLGLTPSGVIVLRNKTTVAHYYWPRIGKVFYKGKYFMLRVCDKNVSREKGASHQPTTTHTTNRLT